MVWAGVCFLAGGSDPVGCFLLALVAGAVRARVGSACLAVSLSGADRGALVGGVAKAAKLAACRRARATTRRVAMSSSLLSSLQPAGCKPVPCCSAGTDAASSLLDSVREPCFSAGVWVSSSLLDATAAVGGASSPLATPGASAAGASALLAAKAAGGGGTSTAASSAVSDTTAWLSSDLTGEHSSLPMICTPHASRLRAYTSCAKRPLRPVPKSLKAAMNCLTLAISSSTVLRK